MEQGQAIERRDAQHYTCPQLERAILTVTIAAKSNSLDDVPKVDLAPVDHFRFCGPEAKTALAALLNQSADIDILDIKQHRPQRETLEGRAHFSPHNGEDSPVSCEAAGAPALPFKPEVLSTASMSHVGMNIADKAIRKRPPRIQGRCALARDNCCVERITFHNGLEQTRNGSAAARRALPLKGGSPANAFKALSSF